MSFDSTALVSAWIALGSAVVDFLWQGTLLGLLTWAALAVLGKSSSATRYAVSLGALCLGLAIFVGSFVASLPSFGHAAGPAIVQLGRAGSTAGLDSPTSFAAADLAAWCWALGASCMALRLALQCRAARRLRTTALSQPGVEWQRTFEALLEELGLSSSVKLLRSGLAEVPMVVGWLSPIVLVPASAFTALSPEQLRALLIHELAHIRRHDHLLNALQAVVEMVLFFHPVIWWVSQQVRLEREHCCDDSAVSVTGNPRLVAAALASLEALRITAPLPTPVLASSGGPLMQRITRILGGRLERRSVFSTWQLPTGLLLTGLLAAAAGAHGMAPPDAQDAEQEVRAEKRRAEAPSLEEAKARIEAALKAGTMTDEEARRVLFGIELRQKFASEQKQIQAAVEAGKLTREQAEQRLVGLRLRLRYAAEEARVKAAVAAGEMTKEQATRELEGLRVQMKKGGAVRGGPTQEQALERIDAYRKSVAERNATGKPVDPKVEYAALEARVMAAVTAGEMTKEQAHQKLQELRERMEYAAVVARIEAAVKAGTITPEQAKARLAGFKQSLTDRKLEGERNAELETLMRKVKEAVKAGDLTPEQAEAKLVAYKKALAERKQRASRGEVTLEGVQRRIEAAVQAGKITAEEGQVRLAEYKRSLARQRTEK